MVLLLLLFGTATAANTETFDYLLLSQEWPFSFCTENKCQNTNKLQQKFNIHGLWPEHVKGECQGEFNYTQLQPLESQLRQAWMDLKNPIGDPEEFWRYEYTKHGKCAAVDPRFASTLQYFSAALIVYTKYDLTKMLARAGIVPGPTPYKASKIIDVLTASFGHAPEIDCFTPGTHKMNSAPVVYLRELRVCFEKDLSPRDCTGGRHQSGTLLYEGGTSQDQKSDTMTMFMEKALELNEADAVWSQQDQQVADFTPGRSFLCKPDDDVLLLDRLSN